MAALRGFAGMSLEQRRAIAKLGGQKSHVLKVAHEWNHDEAQAAGRKGGTHLAQDRAYMAAIGRRGGLRTRHGRKRSASET